MTKPELPTFLGGEFANLAWEDLNPQELIRATVSSMVRAEFAYAVSLRQISAAEELFENDQLIAYRNTALTLASMSGLKTGSEGH